MKGQFKFLLNNRNCKSQPTANQILVPIWINNEFHDGACLINGSSPQFKHGCYLFSDYNWYIIDNKSFTWLIYLLLQIEIIHYELYNTKSYIRER